MSILVEPTEQAHWHRLIQDAELSCTQTLPHDLEAYLVITLMRFNQRPTALDGAMAIQWLQARQLTGHRATEALRDLGDQCLLLSGLFPGLAERRLVRLSYYVDLGRGAYHQLAAQLERATAGLYAALCEGFLSLLEVLHAVRELGGGTALGPLASYELWADTGHTGARRRLQRYSNALPLAGPSRANRGGCH